MKQHRHRNKTLLSRLRPGSTGTFTTEYAVMFFIIVMAILAIAVYMKRAVSAKFRSVGDTFGHGRQYEP